MNFYKKFKAIVNSHKRIKLLFNGGNDIVNFWEALILGLVQGLTEFLPISSSGHLVVSQTLLSVQEPGITFEVMVHFGTFFSVICIFRQDLKKLFYGFLRVKKERKLFFLLFISVVPTGLMGILLRSFFESIFQSFTTVGFMLLITGVIILLVFYLPAGNKDVQKMNALDAILISFAQGMAIIPGISRSGSTITAALARKLDTETAIKFSFLMSLPVILGATLLELKEVISVGFDEALILPYFVATLTAFLSGVLAIKVFIRLLKARKFYYFSFYCWGLGSLVIYLGLRGLY